MDNTAVRSRYPRYGTNAGRRRRTTAAESMTFREKLILQALVCILIFLLTGISRNVTNPISAFYIGSIEKMLTNDIDVGKAYKNFRNTIAVLTGGKIIEDEPLDEPGPYGEEDVMSPVKGGLDYSKTEDEPATQLSGNVSDDTDPEQGVMGNSTKAATASPTPIPTPKPTPVPTPKPTVTPAASKVTFITPVGGLLGSPFGERTDPFTKVIKMHKGIDIEANHGSSIKAAMEGEVLVAAQEATFGNYIKLKHNNGFTTLYAHCSALLVKPGQKVKQGDVIARVGNTGASVGAHLHFEIWKDDKAVDPLTYVKVPTK